MILLWSLIAVGDIIILVAGFQAVRLMQDRDGRIAWLSTQVANRDEKVDATQKQLQASKVLLQQAAAWVEVERQRSHPPSPNVTTEAPAP